MHSQTLYPARGDYARTQCRTRIRFTCKRKSWAAERSLFAGSLDLDQGFANNGVVVRGPFFRWRLDTHRIYILLLLLGKRSSAERLFNTTRSLARPPGYFTIMEPRASRGTACSPPSPPPPPPPASSRSDIQAPIFTLSPAACTATKIEARPGPREWVAAIVNDRPAGRSLSDVHDAILSSPPASEDYRCLWRFLLNRFCYPAGSTREETACREY